jgi:uncharacterized delta-60 repeat protein
MSAFDRGLEMGSVEVAGRDRVGIVGWRLQSTKFRVVRKWFDRPTQAHMPPDSIAGVTIAKCGQRPVRNLGGVRVRRKSKVCLVAALVVGAVTGFSGSAVSRADAAVGPAYPVDSSFAVGSPTPGALFPGTSADLTYGIIAHPASPSSLLVGLGQGFFSNPGTRTRLQRYRADGSIDAAFGTAGTMTLPTSFGDPLMGTGNLSDVAIDHAGRIIVVMSYVVFRFLPNGVRDQAFQPVQISPTFSAFIGADVDSQDRVLLTARATNLTSRTVIARLTVTGTLDTTFASSSAEPGLVASFADLLSRPIVLADGSIVVTGGSGPDAVVEKYTASGAKDTSFGVNGFALIIVGPDSDVVLNASLDAIGNVLLVGVESKINGPRGFAARVSPSGVEDLAFRTNSAPLLHKFGVPRTISVGPDGCARITGNLIGATPGVPAIGLLCGDGEPSLSFGWPSSSGGITRLDMPATSNMLLADSAVFADGSMLISGDSPLAFVRVIAPRSIVDTGAGFNPVVPSRLLDTREGVGAPSGVRVAGSVLTLQIAGYGGVPVSGATAVTLNVTAVDPTSGGFLTVYPCGSDVPNVSNLNFSAGQTVPNLVTVPLGASGTVCFSSPSTTHLLADIAGWFRG